MDLNQSRAVGGNILGPFQGSLTNLGASGRLQSQIQAILGQILTFPDKGWVILCIFYVLSFQSDSHFVAKPDFEGNLIQLQEESHRH